MEPLNLITKIGMLEEVIVREQIEYDEEKAKTKIVDNDGIAFEVIVKKIGEQE